MPNLVERIAEGLGSAVRAYSQAVQGAVRNRPSFLTSWAESSRWNGGDLNAPWAQRRALQNSWVFTAIGMIAREVGAVTLEVVQQTGNDEEPVAIQNHPMEQLLRRPNPFFGRSFLWQYLIYWLQLSGDAYWFVSCDQAGRPVELWPLPSRDVEVVPGYAERFIDYYEYTANGILYRLPAEYVVHFRLTNPFDIFRGLSPLVAAILPADADSAMARWNGTFFGRDNVMPSAIINLSSGDPDIAIDPADLDRLKTDLRGEYQASMRKTAITTANAVSAVLLGWNPKDMDFIAGRQFTKEEIYAIFGIPGGLLDKNATEANATVADQVFKEKTIWPLLCLLAEQITAQLVIPFYAVDHEAVFEDIRPVNRELELREVQAAGPYLTIDEVRQKYWKLDALPNGDGMQRAGQSAAPGMLPFDFGAMRTDLRKWRDKAVKALRNGGLADVPFESDFIPDDIAEHVRQHLEQVTTPDEVKAVFTEAASLEVAASPFCYP